MAGFIGQAATADNNQIILALIALVATSITALVFVIRTERVVKAGATDAATAAAQATAANSAVNNVGDGKHNLYDMVERIRDDVDHLKKSQHQFDSHGWETLPADIGSAVALTTTIRDLQSNYEQVNMKLDTLILDWRNFAWEMDKKWSSAIQPDFERKKPPPAEADGGFVAG